MTKQIAVVAPRCAKTTQPQQPLKHTSSQDKQLYCRKVSSLYHQEIDSSFKSDTEGMATITAHVPRHLAGKSEESRLVW